MDLRRGVHAGGDVTGSGQPGRQRHREAGGVRRADELLGIGTAAVLEARWKRVAALERAAADLHRALPRLEIALPHRVGVPDRHAITPGTESTPSPIRPAPPFDGSSPGSRPSYRFSDWRGRRLTYSAGHGPRGRAGRRAQTVRQRRGRARRGPHDRAGRGRGHARPQRRRQDHVDQPDARPAPAHLRRGAAVRPAPDDRRARSRCGVMLQESGVDRCAHGREIVDLFRSLLSRAAAHGARAGPGRAHDKAGALSAGSPGASASGSTSRWPSAATPTRCSSTSRPWGWT